MAKGEDLKVNTSGGLSAAQLIGVVIAGYCSWVLNHSIFWCAIHSMFGWFYVLYLCSGISGQTLPANFW